MPDFIPEKVHRQSEAFQFWETLTITTECYFSIYVLCRNFYKKGGLVYKMY